MAAPKQDPSVLRDEENSTRRFRVSENKGAQGRTTLALVSSAVAAAGVCGIVYLAVSSGGASQRPVPAPPMRTDDTLLRIDPAAFVPSPPSAATAEPAPTPTPAPPPAKVQELASQITKPDENRTADETGKTEPKPAPPRRRRMVSASLIVVNAAGAAPESEVTQPASGTHPGELGQTPAGPQGKLYSSNRLQGPMPCQVNATTTFPVKIPDDFSTEAGGIVKGVVWEDVFDFTKTCLAIPQGSEMVGLVDPNVSRGSTRARVAWIGVTLPNGRSIEFGDELGYDLDGTAGVSGEIQSNIPWGLIAASTIIDIIPASLGAIAQTPVLSIGSIFGQNVASPLEEVARDKYSKSKPFIKVESKFVLVKLHRHMSMEDFRKQ